MRFINGHSSYKTGSRTLRGYRHIRLRGGKGRYEFEHTLVAEQALGRPLPTGACVHHVNAQRADNRPANLVICESRAYHTLLHRRMRAYHACGQANWRKCGYCGQYDEPTNIYIPPRGLSTHHRSCRNRFQRDLRVSQARSH